MNFLKQNFATKRGILEYHLNPSIGIDGNPIYSVFGGKFIARFKHTQKIRGRFITFLIKNFTVEDYLNRLDQGETPMAILESKGFVV